MITGASSSLYDFESAAFMNGLNDAIANMEVEGRAELRASGSRISRRAKGFLGPHRQTGALAASVGIRSGKDHRGSYVDVGIVDEVLKVTRVNAKTGKTTTKYRKGRGAAESVSVNTYGHYLEYGTRHEAPSPWLRPAVAEEVGVDGGARPAMTIHGPRVKGSTYVKGSNARGRRGVL